MARIEIAVRSILMADPVVSALAGDRIYPHIMPEGEDFPAVTYTVLDDADEVITGPTGLIEADVELTAWARGSQTTSGYTTARDLARAVRDALLGFRGVVEGVHIYSVTGGTVGDAVPDESTEIWQAWISLHVMARE